MWKSWTLMSVGRREGGKGQGGEDRDRETERDLEAPEINTERWKDRKSSASAQGGEQAGEEGVRDQRRKRKKEVKGRGRGLGLREEEGSPARGQAAEEQGARNSKLWAPGWLPEYLPCDLGWASFLPGPQFPPLAG